MSHSYPEFQCLVDRTFEPLVVCTVGGVKYTNFVFLGFSVIDVDDTKRLVPKQSEEGFHITKEQLKSVKEIFVSLKIPIIMADEFAAPKAIIIRDKVISDPAAILHFLKTYAEDFQE